MSVPIGVWIASSIVGLILATWGVGVALGDLEALREIPRNGRYLVARHQLIRYVIRVAMSLALVASALVDVGLVVWLLILVNLGLALTTLSDLVTGAFLRRSVRRKLEANGNEPG